MTLAPRSRAARILEARLTASLEHPHIVQVTDYGQDERLGSWFAMEFLRGEDLQGRIGRDQNIVGARQAFARGERLDFQLPQIERCRFHVPRMRSSSSLASR
ncbi:MAG: hypothetical protein NTY53_17315 [Kiritimatiellaeota bacterium]|nr:hypothetical protein [Kiritimatiellota bacterium]